MRLERSCTGYYCIYYGGKKEDNLHIFPFPRFNSFILPWVVVMSYALLFLFPFFFFDFGKDFCERNSAFFSFCLFLSLCLLTSPYLGISVDIIFIFFFPLHLICAVLIQSTSTISSSGSGYKQFHLRYVVCLSLSSRSNIIYSFIHIHVSIAMPIPIPYIFQISVHGGSEIFR